MVTVSHLLLVYIPKGMSENLLTYSAFSDYGLQTNYLILRLRSGNGALTTLQVGQFLCMMDGDLFS